MSPSPLCWLDQVEEAPPPGVEATQNSEIMTSQESNLLCHHLHFCSFQRRHRPQHNLTLCSVRGLFWCFSNPSSVSHICCVHPAWVTQNLTDRFYTMCLTQSCSSLRGVVVYRQAVSAFYTLGLRILHVIERCLSFQNKCTTTPCRFIIKLPSQEVWRLVIRVCNIQNGAHSSFLPPPTRTPYFSAETKVIVIRQKQTNSQSFKNIFIKNKSKTHTQTLVRKIV